MAVTLKELLTIAIQKKASDLHINAHIPPTIRVDGSLVPIDQPPLSEENAMAICQECLTQEQVMRFEQERSIDLSFGIDGLARFRANIYWALGSVSGAFRAIPYVLPSAKTLGLPDVAIDLTKRPRGLVLVTGQTGSGKSTTLAALLNLINETEAHHIITIEDPIEYYFTQKKSVIHQREIGRDASSFQSALKHILRQDPDVVMIGEMRDLETIQNAITIAETGHLVFATLHTNTADQTIDRIIDVFPPHQQPQIRTELSFILQGILCQQLLPKKNGGRALAMEIMIPTSAIRNLIREGKTHQIYAQMQMGQRESGMRTMDQALAQLVKDGLIAREEALGMAINHDELTKMLDG
ncbi:MAG: type IV pilus twitching motility protein PilT [Deltaproteobacteria bacterium]|nr:type IV pilus twitching motility protein PilT [Deltaproteobacteria bacterium]